MIKSGLLAEIPCWGVRPWQLASLDDDDDDDEGEPEQHDDNDEEEVADCDDDDDEEEEHDDNDKEEVVDCGGDDGNDETPCNGVGNFLCMVPPTSQPSQNILRIKFAEFFGI